MIVTGATSGFGLATAKKFKENGDLVIAVSRNAKKTEDVVRTYGFAAGFSMDVSDYSRWQELKAFVTEKFGRIDVLVNNAGGGIAIADVTDQKEKDIDAAISVNLNSVIYGCSVFGKMMKEQKDGVSAYNEVSAAGLMLTLIGAPIILFVKWLIERVPVAEF